jgi:FtsH-binding integral membrane protein
MSEFSITPEGEGPPQSSSNIDPVKYERRMNELRSAQNLTLAIVAGLLASVVAAVIWALITYLTHYQIGFMAIGVGFLVGFAVKYFGNGMSTAFGIVGAVFSLFGCLLGNILATVIAASFTDGIPILSIVSAFVGSPSIIVEILKETFSFMDLVFYGIAVYEGFRFSIREITADDLRGLEKDTPPPPPPPPPAPPVPAAPETLEAE